MAVMLADTLLSEMYLTTATAIMQIHPYLLAICH